MQVASVKPNTVYYGRGKEWYQHTTKKATCYTAGLAIGYFRLPCGHSRRTRHCRSRAGTRHVTCESALRDTNIVPLGIWEFHANQNRKDPTFLTSIYETAFVYASTLQPYHSSISPHLAEVCQDFTSIITALLVTMSVVKKKKKL